MPGNILVENLSKNDLKTLLSLKMELENNIYHKEIDFNQFKLIDEIGKEKLTQDRALVPAHAYIVFKGEIKNNLLISDIIRRGIINKKYVDMHENLKDNRFLDVPNILIASDKAHNGDQVKNNIKVKPFVLEFYKFNNISLHNKSASDSLFFAKKTFDDPSKDIYYNRIPTDTKNMKTRRV